MTSVFNSSPLIFLVKLRFLKEALYLFEKVVIPPTVLNEISAKDDMVAAKVIKFKNDDNIFFQKTKLTKLYNVLNARLGQGESEAIALAVELNADMVILDDFAARKAAMESGLKVKGTLGIIRKLLEEGVINVEIDEIYKNLQNSGFRVKKEIFDAIFGAF